MHLIPGMTTEPLRVIWDLLSLPPGRILPAIGLLAGFMIVCELVRVALATELTRSVLAHVTLCLLTFPVQSTVLSVVLLRAASSYPGRCLFNLGIVAGLYVVWYLTGESTRLVRPLSEGADLGFMTVSALFTLSAGVVAALISGCR